MKSRFTSYRKSIYHLFFLSLFLGASLYSSATNHIVAAQNYVFTPDSFNAMVGDTVTWQWVDNVHQPASTTIPQGASTWSLTINSGNPTASYVITVPGVYNYQCNFHTLEGMFGKFIVEDIGTRINTVEADNQLKIYPQPFKTKLTIDLNHNSTFKNNVTVEVSNGIGQREYYINTSDILTTPLTMDLSNLAPGIYFVSIREGEIKKTYRLIKSE